VVFRLPPPETPEKRPVRAVSWVDKSICIKVYLRAARRGFVRRHGPPLDRVGLCSFIDNATQSQLARPVAASALIPCARGRGDEGESVQPLMGEIARDVQHVPHSAYEVAHARSVRNSFAPCTCHHAPRRTKRNNAFIVAPRCNNVSSSGRRALRGRGASDWRVPTQSMGTRKGGKGRAGAARCPWVETHGYHRWVATRPEGRDPCTGTQSVRLARSHAARRNEGARELGKEAMCCAPVTSPGACSG